MQNKFPISVTILTGFLGSGKTTLINHLLKKAENKRIAIIENEIGEINIDSELIKNKNNGGIYELTNGCICCSIKGELGITLNSIILTGEHYDHLIVEATGIATPSDIIQTFTEGTRVQKYFKLNCVICIVDAINFHYVSQKFSEPLIQVTQSDILLISKSDKTDIKANEELKRTLHQINPFAPIETTNFGVTNKLEILDLNMHQPGKLEQSVLNFKNLRPVNPASNKHQISSFSIEFSGDLDQKRISLWLEEFLYMNKESILRIKGILSIREMKHRIILQSVGNQYQVFQGEKWDSKEDRLNKIVFIGTKIDETKVTKELKDILRA